jgi:hypothetical protein
MISKYIDYYLREETMLSELDRDIGRLVAKVLRGDSIREDFREESRQLILGFVIDLSEKYSSEKTLSDKAKHFCPKVCSAALKDGLASDEDAAYLQKHLNFNGQVSESIDDIN